MRLVENTGTMVRLLEHPGHADQSVHGHRGAQAGGPGYGEMRPVEIRDSVISRIDPEATGSAIGAASSAPGHWMKGLAAERLSKAMLEPENLKRLCSDPPLQPTSTVQIVNSPILDFAADGLQFAMSAHYTGTPVDYSTQTNDEANAAFNTRHDFESAVLDSVRDWEGMTPEARAATLSTGPHAEALRYAIAAGYVKQWATTAADHNINSLAIQKAAEQEFGLAHLSPEVVGKTWSGDDSAFTEADRVMREQGNFVRGMVRMTYETTQRELAARGIKSLTLARGIMSPDVASAIRSAPGARKGVLLDYNGAYRRSADGDRGVAAEVRVSGHPLQSWAADISVARVQFGPTTFVARVPASRMFSYPLTGQGCHDEREIVVLGGSNDLVLGWATPVDWED